MFVRCAEVLDLANACTNRLENLELRASAHGSGQSVADLLDFVVKHYEREVRIKLEVLDAIRELTIKSESLRASV